MIFPKIHSLYAYCSIKWSKRHNVVLLQNLALDYSRALYIEIMAVSGLLLDII